MTAIVKLGDAFFADLAHTLTGETHLGADLFKTTLLATDTKALANDLQFTVFQNTTEHVLKVRGERFVIYQLVGAGVVA